MIHAVQNNELDGMALRRLLWLINAHPNLIAHAQIFQNIQNLLSSPIFTESSLNWASEWKTDIPSWIQMCNWMQTNRTKLAQTPGLTGFDRYVDGKHPLVGEGVDRHGVVSAIWSSHESGPTSKPQQSQLDHGANAYFALQGHLLVSYIDCRFRLSKLEFYESYSGDDERPIAPTRTGVVGLAVRELSFQIYSPLLNQLPVNASTTDFVGDLVDLHLRLTGLSFEVAEVGSRHMAAILRYFKRFKRVLNGWQPPQKLRRGWGGGSGGHTRVHGFVQASGPQGVYLDDPVAPCSDTDIPSPIGQKIYVNVDSQNDDDPNSVEESGLAPDETLEEVFCLYTPTELQGRIYALRLRQLAAESSAQSLPFDYSRLTTEERSKVDELANKAINAYFQGMPTDKPARQNAVGGLIIRLMLCLGQPLEIARDISCAWIQHIPDAPVTLPVRNAITLVLSAPSVGDLQQASVLGFCLPAIQPEYKTALPENLEEIDQDAVESFLLPDLFGVGVQLLQFLKFESASDFNGFRMHNQTISTAVNQLCAPLKNERITAHKISRSLQTIIRDQTGDQVLGWIVTADQQNARQARMHYNRRTVQKIEQAYVHASRRLLPRFRKRTISALNNPPLNPLISAGVGARFVITFDEVKDIIGRLKDQLTERYRADMTEREVRRYHSQYLLYTHLYQSILSSMRAINQPYDLYHAWAHAAKSKQDIHCSLSDKDSRYTDRARLAPLLDQLAEQFANFRLHLEYLPSKLPMSEPWIFALGPDHPFFVILANHQVQPLTTRWLKEALKHFTGFDIPVNFHRAFLASELFIRGCPIEVIDAHVGHANIGELPFGKCSTFDYDRHFRLLTSALLDIHDALGLEPIGSRLVPFKVRLGAKKP
ncbi:MAG: hypothetical protein COW02_14430 [Comamonadaceae bacterium CG12_big_fil_rev_8_21_14_0_65_59_15]|nr:MAG: hypothetical protein COW02_14430 [Comamonadaceae bacterium CG12_big_fil_rev_8_21_14_0_65_59_15]